MQSVTSGCLPLAHALRATSMAVGNRGTTALLPVIEHHDPTPPTPAATAAGTGMWQHPLSSPPNVSRLFTPSNAGSALSSGGAGRGRATSLAVAANRGGLQLASGSGATLLCVASHASVRGLTGDHRSIQVPDFSAYRRPSTKSPNVKPDRDSARAFTYLMVGGALGSSITFGKWFGQTLVGTWSASKDALSVAKIEVNLKDIPAGKNVVLKWRGKPLFIRHRTQEEIDRERKVDLSTLRDPQADEDRVRGDPRWLVLLGICTHLGCVPISGAGNYGGYYCPCHGSHYDASGRIRKGPAPLNLEIPEYSFLSDDILVVG